MSKHKPTLFILFLVVFLDLIGFGIIIPLLPTFSQKMGASGALLGAAFGVYSLMQFIFAPIWGRLSDRVGRRPVILISLVGSTVSYVIFAYAKNMEVLILSRLLAGIFGANISVANAYVADITTRENRSKGMGVIGAAFGLGFLFGPLLGMLSAPWGDQAPAFVAAGLCGLNFILAFFILPESLTNEAVESSKENNQRSYFSGWLYVLAKPGIGALVIIGFFFNTAITQWETTFALFLQKDSDFVYTLQTYYYLLAYLAILVVIIQGGLIGRITKRVGEIPLLRFGLLMLIVSLAWLPFTRNIPQLVGSLTLLSLGMGFTRPVMSGAVSLLSRPEEQGLVLGVFMGVSSLARIIGPLVGGALHDLQFRLPFLVAAAFALFAWILALRSQGKPA